MSKKHDSYESIRDERRYGPYWYSALWRIIRPILIGLGTVLAVAGILFSVWNKVYGEFIAPPDESSTAQVPFTIESGQSLTRVANRLEEAGLIRNRTVFKYYCDFAGWGQKIQSGSYTLSPSMTMRQIADQLTRGDGNPIVRNITLIPGWTIEQFAEQLQVSRQWQTCIFQMSRLSVFRFLCGFPVGFRRSFLVGRSRLLPARHAKRCHLFFPRTAAEHGKQQNQSAEALHHSFQAVISGSCLPERRRARGARGSGCLCNFAAGTSFLVCTIAIVYAQTITLVQSCQPLLTILDDYDSLVSNTSEVAL